MNAEKNNDRITKEFGLLRDVLILAIAESEEEDCPSDWIAVGEDSNGDTEFLKYESGRFYYTVSGWGDRLSETDPNFPKELEMVIKSIR